MRILIARSSKDQVVGGAELSARDIARALIVCGQEVIIVTNIRKKVITGKIPKHNIIHPPTFQLRIKCIDIIVQPFVSVMQFIWYFIIVLQFKPDIISPHSRKEQTILTLIGKILNIPVIWRDPGDLHPQLDYPVCNILQKVNRIIQKIAIKGSTHVFTLNESDRKAILGHMPKLSPDKVSVIKSNILFEDYVVKLKEIKKNNTIVLGSVSRLEEHKGIQYLIEAFSKLQSSYNNKLTLMIAGDGQYKKRLEKMAESTQGVFFIGRIDDVSEIFNEIDIFVQPAEFEGWGRNIKEAKYFEKAIVASKIGGIKDQIKNKKDGLLFKVGDVTALCENLKLLIESPNEMKKLAKSARLSAVDEGDWIHTVELEIIPLFEKYIRK